MIAPPPLTPPHKGEGDVNLSESPSPLWGGVRGGGVSHPFDRRLGNGAIRLQAIT